MIVEQQQNASALAMVAMIDILTEKTRPTKKQWENIKNRVIGEEIETCKRQKSRDKGIEEYWGQSDSR